MFLFRRYDNVVFRILADIVHINQYTLNSLVDYTFNFLIPYTKVI